MWLTVWPLFLSKNKNKKKLKVEKEKNQLKCSFENILDPPSRNSPITFMHLCSVHKI
jgi:hypothetical protein